MLKKVLVSTFKRLLLQLGYEINRVRPISQENGYSLYQYLDNSGNFDYEMYRKVQQEGNRKKLNRVWVIEENIAFLADYLERRLGEIQFGLCHGTRRGLEQTWFRDILGAEVLGTEISDTAEEFPNTIRWDFHEVKEEWIDSVDFIYSNSFDHTYDPEACLNAWMSCLRSGGLCVLEHSSLQESGESRRLDPFGADLTVMPYLIAKWGKGDYGVRELLDPPRLPESVDHMQYIVIQRF